MVLIISLLSPQYLYLERKALKVIRQRQLLIDVAATPMTLVCNARQIVLWEFVLVFVKGDNDMSGL